MKKLTGLPWTDARLNPDKTVIGLDVGPDDDAYIASFDVETEPEPLLKYAEQYIAREVFDTERFARVLWAGSLTDNGEDIPLPKRKPWRVRMWRKLSTFVWAYAPRVHFGPCCTDCWEC